MPMSSDYDHEYEKWATNFVTIWQMRNRLTLTPPDCERFDVFVSLIVSGERLGPFRVKRHDTVGNLKDTLIESGVLPAAGYHRRHLRLILNQTDVQRDSVRLGDITEYEEIPSPGLYINDLVYAPDVMPPLPLSLELVVTQHQQECARPGCTAIGNFRKCGGCRRIRYCREACQNMHWPFHKANCYGGPD